MRITLPFVSLAALAVALAPGNAFAQPTAAASPAFSAKQLAAWPTDGWITNGGNVFNQRYSPLTRINRDNVAQLKAYWRTHLNGSGMGPQYSGSGAAPRLRWRDLRRHRRQRRVRSGRRHGRDPVDLRRAAAIRHCRHLLRLDEPRRRPGRRQDVRRRSSTAGSSRSTRGPARKSGPCRPSAGRTVFASPARRCTTTAWSSPASPAARWASAAGSRPSMREDGQAACGPSTPSRARARSATTPGPQTATPGSTAAAPCGRRRRWIPQLGLIYFSTGNPGPDLNGAVRPGDNLFTVSMVAIEAKTGKYRWHFQQVHHDIWDYDAPNPVVLFDAPYEGKMRKGIAQVGKTGWAYILDRDDGQAADRHRRARRCRRSRGRRPPATQPYPRRRCHRAAARSTSRRKGYELRQPRRASSRRSGQTA